MGQWLSRNVPQTRLLLVGGEADDGPLATVRAALRPANALLAQNLPLPHLAAVLQRCRLFLGHDSGISHLAAAVGTPCVLLFGPTDPAVWAPPNPAVKIVTAPRGDLRELSPATVEQAVSEALEGIF